MFLDFYKMREQPFGVTPDPRFLFLGESHREALASLFCGIEADRGFMALIAHPGLGKTTLTFQLLEKLRRTSRTVFLFQTQCNSRELFQYILNDLGVDSSGMEVVTMHNKLNEILYQEMLACHRFVIAIDEAHNLDPTVLETLRLLSNFETPHAKLLQIVLIGQPQLARTLAEPSLLQLKQRITTFARLEPFDIEDTSRYIAHRLKVAGYGGDPLFTHDALRMIAERSQGIPRCINSLCFSSLSLGCAMDRKRIDVEIINEAFADLDLEPNKPAIQFSTPNPKVAAHPLLSYRKESKRRLGRWALEALGIAACIAIGVVTISSPSSRISRFWQNKAEVVALGRNVLLSLRRVADAPTASSRISPQIEQANGAPISTPTSTLPSDGPETIKVIVQSGETLRHITLRTLGRYNDRLIQQIQSLNAGMTDPNHIEANQTILLPRISKPLSAPDANGADYVSEKN